MTEILPLSTSRQVFNQRFFQTVLKNVGISYKRQIYCSCIYIFSWKFYLWQSPMKILLCIPRQQRNQINLIKICDGTSYLKSTKGFINSQNSPSFLPTCWGIQNLKADPTFLTTMSFYNKEIIFVQTRVFLLFTSNRIQKGNMSKNVPARIGIDVSFLFN